MISTSNLECCLYFRHPLSLTNVPKYTPQTVNKALQTVSFTLHFTPPYVNPAPHSMTRSASRATRLYHLRQRSPCPLVGQYNSVQLPYCVREHCALTVAKSSPLPMIVSRTRGRHLGSNTPTRSQYS